MGSENNKFELQSNVVWIFILRELFPAKRFPNSDRSIGNSHRRRHPGTHAWFTLNFVAHMVSCIALHENLMN